MYEYYFINKTACCTNNTFCWWE